MGARELRAGERLASTACSTEVVVVRAPSGPVELTCAGAPMAPAGGAAAAAPLSAPSVADPRSAIVLGKRYVDEESGLEVLCTKGGTGPLQCDGRPMALKAPKPLPSSD
jgi:hypothetical protein